jgi:hypothetical protein
MDIGGRSVVPGGMFGPGGTHCSLVSVNNTSRRQFRAVTLSEPDSRWPPLATGGLRRRCKNAHRPRRDRTRPCAHRPSCPFPCAASASAPGRDRSGQGIDAGTDTGAATAEPVANVGPATAATPENHAGRNRDRAWQLPRTECGPFSTASAVREVTHPCRRRQTGVKHTESGTVRILASTSRFRLHGLPGYQAATYVVFAGDSASGVPGTQSHYDEASRGVLRVGARCPCTELIWGRRDFSSITSLAIQRSATPFYASDLRLFKSSVGCTGQATNSDRTGYPRRTGRPRGASVPPRGRMPPSHPGLTVTGGAGDAIRTR